MKVSLILEAIDRATAPVKRVQAAVQSLNHRAIVPLERGAGRAGTALNRLWSDAARGERIGLRVGAAMRVLATRGFDAVRRSAASAGAATSTMLSKVGKYALIGAGGVAAGGVAAGIGFGRSIIATGSEFEQYSSRLKTALGSTEKAAAALKFIEKFGADTPYEIGAVTQAFIVAKNQGIDPFNGSMMDMGDAASAMGKTMEEAALAIGDAGRGQFERMLDFGINASKKGGAVTLSYVDKNGKAMSRSVSKNTLDVQRAILEIFRTRYGGGMLEQSKTLAGIWANLKDQWTLFKLNVANRGIFDRVKRDLEGVYAWVQRLQKDGTLDRWAKDVSDWLLLLWDRAEYFIKNTDWRAVAVEVAAITRNVVELVGAIGQAAAAIGNWRMTTERTRLNNVINNPTVGQMLFTDRPKAIREAQGQLTALDRLQYGEPQAQRRGGSVIWPENSFRRAPSRPAVPSSVPGKAKISLHVTTERGVSVRPTGMKAAGLDVEVNTGRAMTPFA